MLCDDTGHLPDEDPRPLEVGEEVAVRGDPLVAGTLIRLQYHAVEGENGNATIRLARSHGDSSFINEQGVIASGFRLKGTLLSVATRELRRAPKGSS